MRRLASALVLLLTALQLSGCGLLGGGRRAATRVPITEPVMQTPQGNGINLYTLRNANGMEARITNYGGIIVSLTAPDRNGRYEDVVLGFDTVPEYQNEHPYFGALIGRYGNRIAEGRFTLNGQTFTLARNNGPNALHGGIKGFDKVVWDAEPFASPEGPALRLTYTSPAGEEGYPGALTATVVYTLTADDAVRIDYDAVTDADTPINLTNHSYFNLTGGAERDILGHVMMINADRFTPVDSTLIPTGELQPVEGTPFDFRLPKPIGRDIGETDDQQIRFGGGYDHNFVLNGVQGELRLAARVTEPTSGRQMEVYTTEPGVQFYTGNFLTGAVRGKDGLAYPYRYGFCLETQHFPDSPNHPNFPDTILEPGERYTSTTVYKFATDQDTVGQ